MCGITRDQYAVSVPSKRELFTLHYKATGQPNLHSKHGDKSGLGDFSNYKLSLKFSYSR